MWSNFYCAKSELLRCFSAATLALLLLTGASANWRDELPDARLIGQGEYRWFGLAVYSAQLWSAHQPFVPDAPYALELHYYRTISRAQLVSASLDQMQQLAGSRFTSAQWRTWEQEMGRAFHDVVPGDQFIGLYLPQQGCRFYDKQGLTVTIADPEFAQLFFAIWLDPRSKNKKLRSQLLGAPQ